jgi:sulfonate transport system substrate-binding protein
MIGRRHALLGTASVPFAVSAAVRGAHAAPAKLATPVDLAVGVAKVAHLAPFATLVQDLAPLGVRVNYSEFVRFADSRTAMASGSLDVAVMAPGDLPLLLSQGVTSVVGLMGVGSSKKHPIVRNGAKCESWDDLRKLRLGVPPGSAVWYQFVAKIQELGFRYDQFQTVNIQGAGSNFVQALQRGDVDAYIQAEPTETMPEMGGFGAPAQAVDYSDARATGQELGLVTASKSALAGKAEAVKLLIGAYKAAEKKLAADQAVYATAIQHWCGLDAAMSTRIAAKIKLGGVVDADQLVRLAAFLKLVGILQKDVASTVPAYFDAAFVQSAIAG